MPDTEYLVHPDEIEALSGSEAGMRKPLTFARFLRQVRAKRGMVRTIFAVIMTLALVYALLRKPVFSSTTSLMPPDSSSNTSNLMALLATTPGAATASSLLPGIKTPSAIFVGVLQSRAAQEVLVQRFDLLKHYKVRYSEDACKALAGHTAVDENTKNGIVSITVSDHDPVFAAQLAKAYVETLNQITSRNSTSSARRERIFLEGRVNDIKSDLAVASRALSQFATRTKAIDPQVQARAMVDSGLKLETELASARSDYAGLRATYSEDNVRVHAASARIAELEHEMAKMSGGASDGANSTIDGSASYPTVSALPTLGVTYAELQRRVSVDETLWAALTKQYETARVEEAKEIPTVRVLDPADVPERKSSMGRVAVLLIGVLVSCLVSLVAVLVTAAWENISELDERKRLLREMFSRA